MNKTVKLILTLTITTLLVAGLNYELTHYLSLSALIILSVFGMRTVLDIIVGERK